MNTTNTTRNNVFARSRRGVVDRYASTDFRPIESLLEKLTGMTPINTWNYHWTLEDGMPVTLTVESLYLPFEVLGENYVRCTLMVGDRQIDIERIENRYDHNGRIGPIRETYKTADGDLVVELVPLDCEENAYIYRCTWSGRTLTIIPERCSGINCLYGHCGKPVATQQGWCSSGHAYADIDFDDWERADSSN